MSTCGWCRIKWNGSTPSVLGLRFSFGYKRRTYDRVRWSAAWSVRQSSRSYQRKLHCAIIARLQHRIDSRMYWNVFISVRKWMAKNVCWKYLPKTLKTASALFWCFSNNFCNETVNFIRKNKYWFGAGNIEICFSCSSAVDHVTLHFRCTFDFSCLLHKCNYCKRNTWELYSVLLKNSPSNFFQHLT